MPPDGSRFLYVRQNSPITRPALARAVFVARADGSMRRRLTHYKDGTWIGSASFSPDGKWITIAKAGRGAAADVFVMRADGSGVRPVTRTTLWDSAPDWGAAG